MEPEAGLICMKLHDAAGGGVLGNGGEGGFPGGAEDVVVGGGEAVFCKIFADTFGCGEVVGTATHRAELAGGDAVSADGEVMVCGDPEGVV